MRFRRPYRGSVYTSVMLGMGLGACAGGGGGGLATSFSGASPAPVPDAFECVRKELKAAGYRQTSYDTDLFRVEAQKYDETVRRSDVTFRRNIDRLAVEVAPGSEGAVTKIGVEASTFAEFTTHRGPTEEQQETSEAARTVAQSLLQKCSAPVDSLSVQG